jgi:beta-lactamase class A
MAISLPAAVRDPPRGVAWSLCVRDLGSGAVLASVDAAAVLPIASVGKLFLLAEVARRIEAGELASGERLARTRADGAADSGLWQHLAVEELTAGDLATLVGAVSDNLAANVLLRRVGLERVQATTRALGLRASALHDRVRDERGPQHPPALASGSAAELSAFLVDLHGPVGERVLGWLAAGSDLSMVASALGLDPLAHAQPDRGLRLRHKTGTDAGVRADAGRLEGPAGGVAYAVLARFDDEYRDTVLGAMRAVGEALRPFVLHRGSAMQAVPTRSKPRRA